MPQRRRSPAGGGDGAQYRAATPVLDATPPPAPPRRSPARRCAHLPASAPGTATPPSRAIQAAKTPSKDPVAAPPAARRRHRCAGGERNRKPGRAASARDCRAKMATTCSSRRSATSADSSPSTPAAAEAAFLIAEVLEKTDAMKMRWPRTSSSTSASPRIAGYRRAAPACQLTFQSRQPDRENDQARFSARIATAYPKTPQAHAALQVKLRIERQRRCVKSIPCSVSRCRQRWSRCATDRAVPERADDTTALNRLAEM